jgi:hypothetical protein
MTERIDAKMNHLEHAAFDPAVYRIPVYIRPQELPSCHHSVLSLHQRCDQPIDVTFASHSEVNVTRIHGGPNLPGPALRLRQRVWRLR